MRASDDFWTTLVTPGRAVMVRTVVGRHWSDVVEESEHLSTDRLRVWVAAGEDVPLAVEIELPANLDDEFQIFESLRRIGLEWAQIPAPTVFPVAPPGGPDAYVWSGADFPID